jgi:hypothetical protein
MGVTIFDSVVDVVENIDTTYVSPDDATREERSCEEGAVDGLVDAAG